MPDRYTIDHRGIIESVENRVATVRINSQSACASCHAKGACSSADQSEKVIHVSVDGLEVFPGDAVKVRIARRTGLRAVAFGYIYPFFVLLFTLIALTIAGVSEQKAGLWSLASLVPYYFGVYLLKERISNSFMFKLEKLF